MKLFLYAPQDFQNICSIARNLEFFGQKECFVYDPNRLIRPRYGKSNTQKIRNISAWAFEKIQFHTVENPIDFLKQHTGRKIVTVLDSTASEVFSFQYQENDMIIFGNEATGLPSEIIQIADAAITIFSKWQTQSLNLSQTVAIILYDVASKVHKNCND